MPDAGKEAVSLTQRLLRTPSVNPPAETALCAGVLMDFFQQNGVQAEINESGGVSNVVARLTGRGPGKTLVLNGHIDVVPAGEGWTVDPFGGMIKDGLLYGRGACDMKSGVAAMAAALVGFKRSGADFDGEIIFMGVGDEETGSLKGTVHLLEAGVGRGADMAIVAEPTDLEIHLGNRGLRWIDVEVKGKSCHAGRPAWGINAVSAAARLVEAVQSQTYRLMNDQFEVPQPSISVTMINGGTKVNVIPNRCRLSIDRRMLPGETSETVKNEIEGLIAGVLNQTPGPEISYEFHPGYWDPYVISPREPIVETLVDSFRRTAGREPVIGTKGACTDGSHLYHLGGMPTVLFGPGQHTLSHQVDECVGVDKIETATQVLLDALASLYSD